MAAKIQYIEKRRRKYWFIRAIPKAHKDNPFFFFHGKNFRVNLHTDSLSVAIRRKEEVLHDWDLALESGNGGNTPREIYKLTQDSIKANEYAVDSDGIELNDYGIHQEYLIDSWSRKYPTGSDGNPLGVTEADMAELKAIQDAEAKAKGCDVPNRYPMTLIEVAENVAAVKESLGISEKELKRYIGVSKSFTDFFGSDVPITEIDYKLVRAFIVEKLSSEITPKTIGNHLSKLSQVWEEARVLGEVAGEVINPFLNHKLPRHAVNRDMLQLHQVRLILTQDITDEDSLLYLMGYYTGARAEELLSLNKIHIVEREGQDGELIPCLSVAERTKENPKGGKTENATRLIPIHSALLPYLENFEGFKTSYSSFNKRRSALFNSLFGEDSKGKLSFHSLRHTFVTQLTNNIGGNIAIVKMLAGHSKKGLGITGSYYHGAGLQQLKDAIETIEVL